MKYMGGASPAPVTGLLRGRKVLAAIKLRAEADPSFKSGCEDGTSRQPNGGDLVDELRQSIRDNVLSFPMPSEATLRALFNLTSAEARVAQRLASGDSVEEVARSLSIKMTTARTQLAAIFDKTNTRRQARLVALLSRVAHLEERVSLQKGQAPVRVENARARVV